jgi:hypothetical protein
MAEYLHRIVYCSERKGRCRRDEITVTGTDMMVTRVEEMQPYYEEVMERFRKPGEENRYTREGLRYWSGFKGCPFCGNRETVFCRTCERYSCWNQQKTVHVCGWCERISETVYNPELPISDSGHVHGAPRRVEPPRRTVIETQGPEKIEEREGIKKYLQYKKTGQLPAPPEEPKPQLPPPEPPKQLPPSPLSKYMLTGPEEKKDEEDDDPLGLKKWLK